MSRVLEIEIPDSANNGPPRTAKVIVKSCYSGEASYERGFYTDGRYGTREYDDISLGNGRFEILISNIRNAIKVMGGNQGWLDRNARVHMPNDK